MPKIFASGSAVMLLYVCTLASDFVGTGVKIGCFVQVKAKEVSRKHQRRSQRSALRKEGFVSRQRTKESVTCVMQPLWVCFRVGRPRGPSSLALSPEFYKRLLGPLYVCWALNSSN